MCEDDHRVTHRKKEERVTCDYCIHCKSSSADNNRFEKEKRMRDRAMFELFLSNQSMEHDQYQADRELKEKDRLIFKMKQKEQQAAFFSTLASFK